MLKEFLIRVLIGGAVVSAFAFLSDMFTPKRFAGLFSAAPSVALATLALTASKEGKEYAAIEARSMIAGELAFVVYAWATSAILIQWKPPAMKTSVLMLSAWSVLAFGMWAVFLR